MNQRDRDTTTKLRDIAQQAIQRGIDLGSVFSKFAGQGSDKIGQDEMLIAMARVSDNIQLGDVKELHRIVIGAPNLNGIEDEKISINEVV